MPTTEDKARENSDWLLAQAGWTVRVINEDGLIKTKRTK